MNPHVLAGAKALARHWFPEPDECLTRPGMEGESPLSNHPGQTAHFQKYWCDCVEAVIRSLPNGEGLLSGSHAVLPVEATEEMYEAGKFETEHDGEPMRDIWRAMVRAAAK